MGALDEGPNVDSIEERTNSLPKGFSITSADNNVAQDVTRIGFGETLFWDPETRSWQRAVTGMEMGGVKNPIHMFVSRVGKNRMGKHYSWDKLRQLWVVIPNPPTSPPDAAHLSPTLPGFAYALDAQGNKMYQWLDDEQQWIAVDDVPWGFADHYGSKVSGRYEAAMLDNPRVRIYWDGKRRSWIDIDTEKPPVPRPPPPSGSEIVGYYAHWNYNEGDMVKMRDEERYYLWSKEKKRWVMLADLPAEYHRGENPNEAYLTDGSALDHWLAWDNSREVWVEFGTDRRLDLHGRIG